jgi:hypothetical protein
VRALVILMCGEAIDACPTCSLHDRYHSCAQARAAIFEFIELFYNPVRQHSHLNGLSPMQFERVLHG